jgi:hypothetical protein
MRKAPLSPNGEMGQGEWPNHRIDNPGPACDPIGHFRSCNHWGSHLAFAGGRGFRPLPAKWSALLVHPGPFQPWGPTSRASGASYPQFLHHWPRPQRTTPRKRAKCARQFVTDSLKRASMSVSLRISFVHTMYTYPFCP